MIKARVAQWLEYYIHIVGVVGSSPTTRIERMILSNNLKKKIYWTKHAKQKMKEYFLSKTKVRKVLQEPVRKEKGVAPNTIAVMNPIFKKKRRTEIWVMYQDTKQKRKIIAAWRYPGETPIGDKIPIPEDIASHLKIKNK